MWPFECWPSQRSPLPYWHRATEVPSAVLDQMVSLAQAQPDEVRRAALFLTFNAGQSRLWGS